MEKTRVPFWVKFIAIFYTILGIGSIEVLSYLLMFVSPVVDGVNIGLMRIALILISLFCIFLVFLAGRALYFGKNWARILFVVLGSFSLINSAHSVFKSGYQNPIIFGLSSLLTILVIRYLVFGKSSRRAFGKI